jgi:two-component system, cell cycle sensor histidine kinase PleC
VGPRPETGGEAESLAVDALEAASALAGADDPRRLLERLTASAWRLAEAQGALVARPAPASGAWRVEVSDGLPAEAVEDVLHAALGPVDGRALEGTLGRGSAVVAVPLGSGATSAVLAVAWTRRSEATPARLSIVRALASSAAAALGNLTAVTEVRAASRLGAEFAAAMSHELRAPLNVIIGYADLLLDGGFGELDGEQRDIVARILGSGRHLLDMIAATLDLSRLDVGKAHLLLEPVEVPAFFAELAEELVSAHRQGTVDVSWRPAPGLPSVETDRRKLRLVLKQLVANALRFTERGAITVAAEEADGAVRFSVTDTGIGIPEGQLPLVFEMFRHRERIPARPRGGVGLGLYVVRRLLEVLGGTVAVESVVGQGTRVEVSLPVRPASAT